MTEIELHIITIQKRQQAEYENRFGLCTHKITTQFLYNSLCSIIYALESGVATFGPLHTNSCTKKKGYSFLISPIPH